MSIKVLKTDTIASVIKSAAKRTSYRSVAARFQFVLGHKISASKLWRIANKKQDVSASDLLAIINLYNIDVNSVISERR